MTAVTHPLVIWLDMVSDYFIEDAAACPDCANRIAPHGFCAVLHGDRIASDQCPGVAAAPPRGFAGYPRTALRTA